jgi:hypothetical protein
MYPSKGFKKFGHKNAMKHENSGSPWIFSQPQVPPSKEYENNCASTSKNYSILIIKTLLKSTVKGIALNID